MGKLRKRGPDPESVVPGGTKAVVDGLFPKGHPVGATNAAEGRWQVVPISLEEVSTAAQTLPAKKAPGPDGLPNEAIKLAAETIPERFVDTYTRCLEEGIFPRIWKSARLALIPKGDKPRELPGSYRPICLLDGAGKLLEKILTQRAEGHLEEQGGLHERQYGFRKGRSTTDAVEAINAIVQRANEGPLRRRKHAMLVSLDVKNAFNTLPWRRLHEDVGKKLPPELARIVRNYLSDREITYEVGNRRTVRQPTSQGVPQGSVIGPFLWNLTYDEVLRIALPPGVETVCFADDLAIIIVHRDIEEVKRLATEAAAAVLGWLERAGLEVAVQKTEAIWLAKRRAGRQQGETVSIGGIAIPITKTTKYLGVWMEANPNKSHHCREATEAARRAEVAISRLLPNVGGAGEGRRRLLSTVAKAKLSYAAPAWGEAAMSTARNAQRARAALRTGALRITRAYRTVSTAAAEVLSSTIPGDLYVRMRAEIHHRARETGNKSAAKKEANERARASWQERWGLSVSWTREVLPEVAPWIDRKHGTLTHHLTQLLTGHGSFGKYLHKIGKAEDPSCKYCDSPNDDARHTLIECPEWAVEREQLEQALGTLTAENLGGRMASDERCWNAVERFAAVTIGKKLEDERTSPRAERHDSQPTGG